MKDEPISNVMFLTEGHGGFDPNLGNLVNSQNGNYDCERFLQLDLIKIKEANESASYYRPNRQKLSLCVLGLNAQSGMRNNSQTLLRNEFTGCSANAVGAIFDSDKCVL